VLRKCAIVQCLGQLYWREILDSGTLIDGKPP